MADADREHWDRRHAVPSQAGSSQAGSSQRVEPRRPERLDPLIDRVPASGRMLDVACGTGAQSLWAARRGLGVDALDISPRAIDRLVAAADELGVAGLVDARVVDLDHGLPVDLTGPYDLVLMQRFRAPHLLPELVARSAPAGLVVVSVLSEVGLDGEPGRFHASEGELEREVAAFGLETLLSIEADGLATIVLAHPRPSG